MASSQQPDLNGYSKPSSGNDSTEWFDQGPGEIDEVTVETFEPWKGDYGHIVVDGQRFSLNKTQRNQLLNGLVVGEEIAISTESEESSFDRDGETISYYETSILVRDGDD